MGKQYTMEIPGALRDTYAQWAIDEPAGFIVIKSASRTGYLMKFDADKHNEITMRNRLRCDTMAILTSAHSR
jgi:hypothetical protein